MITVCVDDIRRMFPPDRDVTVGRDVRADLRLTHPGISRAHVILKCPDGHWIAVDNNSANGMYVGNERVQSAPVRDGTAIHMGDPDGPRLSFELGPLPDERPTTEAKLPAIPDGATVEVSRDHVLRTITVGRELDNDVVVNDVLVSRHHAKLVPTPAGMLIQDARSINGTFLNGERVKSAPVRDGDVINIGNADFVFIAGTLVPRTQPGATTGGLDVHGVGLTIEDDDRVLLDRVSFTARPGSLTAVIGPSGCGKSTLLKVLVGVAQPTSGSVSFDGRDVHAEYASLRSRIGMVPQDDALHDGLTVTQALDIAARLRMAPDTSKSDRQQVISQALQELEMTVHAGKRLEQLSGGQRKRVSVAMELLTEPSLLVLDEPTTGLDPALDRQVMTMLRRLADAGRVIVVVTHSLTFIDVCDQVVLLAPGGKTAYCGPPAELGEAMGSTDWADTFNRVCDDPDGVQRAFFERRGPVREPAPRPSPGQSVAIGKPSRTSFAQQFAAISLRQIQLLFASRRTVAFLVAAPILVGLLPLTVKGGQGFGAPPAGSVGSLEPRQLIVMLSFATILLGMMLSVRDLIGERAIFRHEQAAGLSASAYLLAKIGVFGAVAVFDSAILVLLVTAPGIGKPGPSTAAVLGNPMLELFIDVAAMSVVAVILGLAISAVSTSSNQYIPLMAAACVAQLVLAGSFVPLTGRPVLEAIAAFTASRWGVAAIASTVDLTQIAPTTGDPHWEHTASVWLFNMTMLSVLAVLFAGFVWWRLRRTTKA
jgi:ABC-type multidrug transport system ATPase subunit